MDIIVYECFGVTSRAGGASPEGCLLLIAMSVVVAVAVVAV